MTIHAYVLQLILELRQASLVHEGIYTNATLQKSMKPIYRRKIIFVCVRLASKLLFFYRFLFLRIKVFFTTRSTCLIAAIICKYMGEV